MKRVICVILSQMLVAFACLSFRSVGQPVGQLQANQSSSSPSQAGRRQWQAATYRGLTMGKSTRADMLRLLGQPVETKPYKDGKESGTLYGYTAEDIPGELVVTVQSRTNIILNVEINPQNLSKEEAIRRFGEDYEVTRYDFDLCLGDGESAPLYESGTGNLAYIEYRSRGIALLPNAENKIDEIKYVSEPLGASSSKVQKQKPLIGVGDARKNTCVRLMVQLSSRMYERAQTSQKFPLTLDHHGSRVPRVFPGAQNLKSSRLSS